MELDDRGRAESPRGGAYSPIMSLHQPPIAPSRTLTNPIPLTLTSRVSRVSRVFRCVRALLVLFPVLAGPRDLRP